MPKSGDGRTTLLGVLAAGIITYILLALYFKNIALVYGQDCEEILAPLFFDISRSIHEYGLWSGMYDPGQVAGLSLWNTPYFHPLYPFYFNWLGTDANIFDTMARLQLIDLLHLSIYSAGSYFLCRTMGVRPLLSFAAGLAAPWFPCLYSLLCWPQILASFAWIPWVMVCQLVLYKDPRPSSRAAATVALGVTFALLVYAQPAQNMVLAIMGSGITWVCVAVAWICDGTHEARRRLIRSTLSLAGSGIIALLLCGKYLFSVVVYMSKAIRWAGSGGIIIGQNRMPLAAFQEHALHWRDIVALVSYRPEHTVIIGNLYVGAPLLLCAALLFTRTRREHGTRALLCSAVITVLFCFGLLAPVLQWIPVANKVRELNWWSCYAVAILLPLGTYGLQMLFDMKQAGSTKASSERKFWLGVVVAGFVATIIVLLIDKGSLYEISIVCCSFAIILAYGSWRVANKWRDIPAAAVVILSACVPVIAYPRYSSQVYLLTQPDRVRAREEATQLADHIPDRNDFRFAVSTDLPNFKYFTTALANLDLRGIRGNVSPQEYDKFRLLFFPNQTVANLYGVKYEIIPSNQSHPADAPIDQHVSLRINTGALPRLFFVQGGLKVVNSPINSLINANTPDGKVFFMSPRDVPRHFDLSPYTAGEPAIILPDAIKNTPVDVHASLHTTAPGLFVLNEDPAAHWRAILDGKSIAPIRINGFQTAFPIAQAGQHQLEIWRPSHLF